MSPESLDVITSYDEKGQKLLELGSESHLRNFFLEARSYYEGAIRCFKQALDARPHDRVAREGISRAWDLMCCLYPVPYRVESIPESNLVGMAGSAFSPSFFQKIRCVLLDNIIEGDWRKQCQGQFGGDKPVGKNWKQFYEDNELVLESLSHDASIVWAIQFGHYALLSRLYDVQHLSFLDSIDEVSWDSLLLMAIQKNYTEVAISLIEKGVKINVLGAGNWSVLHWSVYRQNLLITKSLLEHGAKASAKDCSGLTPLHWAAFKGSIPIVNLLIEHKAAVNVLSNEGVSPLHWAIFSGYQNMVSFLLHLGANVNVQDLYGRTLLHWAATNGRLQMVVLLLEHGAKVNVKDAFQRTPLHWAAHKGFYDIVKLLLEHHAHPNVRDKFGDRPLLLASMDRHSKLVSLLFDNGAR
ncbi:MAG: hypothetical protein EXS67_04505 [Candidatus Margulisbacteria bacterium]|nr:hypothetical protein [Candidatus Margulisiibacteriota bacterium]